MDMGIEALGAAVFGLVIGWVTYRTLRRSADKVGLSDIASVIGAIGGAAVIGLFDDPTLFAWYSVGLGIGFFGYLGVAYLMSPKATVPVGGVAPVGGAAPVGGVAPAGGAAVAGGVTRSPIDEWMDGQGTPSDSSA